MSHLLSLPELWSFFRVCWSLLCSDQLLVPFLVSVVLFYWFLGLEMLGMLEVLHLNLHLWNQNRMKRLIESFYFYAAYMCLPLNPFLSLSLEDVLFSHWFWMMFLLSFRCLIFPFDLVLKNIDVYLEKSLLFLHAQWVTFVLSSVSSCRA